jgi:hypothetical protein
MLKKGTFAPAYRGRAKTRPFRNFVLSKRLSATCRGGRARLSRLGAGRVKWQHCSGALLTCGLAWGEGLGPGPVGASGCNWRVF